MLDLTWPCMFWIVALKEEVCPMHHLLVVVLAYAFLLQGDK